jgi:pyruvate formate lyase activating enzyme
VSTPVVPSDPPRGGYARPDASAVTGDWRPVPGYLHSWDVSTGVDGPGTRFVAFLSGCPLRCRYCQNPDTWRLRSGEPTTAGQVLARAEHYRRFAGHATTGSDRRGGLTVSGGEPLRQPKFTTALFTGAREAGLHTALDTSGSLGALAGPALLAVTDLVLLDIKSWHPALYRWLTGGQLAPTLQFARRLADAAIPVWLRFVLVPGVTDEESNVAGVARFAAELGNVERVDVLPFHRLGTAKYERLGLEYPLRDAVPPDAALLDRVRGQFTEAGLWAC